MKKLLALLLVAGFLMVSLTGCSPTTASKTGTTSTSTQTTTTKTP